MCRLTFETADSSGSVAVVKADVKVVSSFGHPGGRIECNAAHSNRRVIPKRVICCLMTVYIDRVIHSNAVFTLLSMRYTTRAKR
jgi:hypothetical protein